MSSMALLARTLILYVIPCIGIAFFWWFIQSTRSKQTTTMQYVLIFIIWIALFSMIDGGAGSFFVMAAVPTLMLSTVCMLFYLLVKKIFKRPITKSGIYLVCVLASIVILMIAGVVLLQAFGSVIGNGVNVYEQTMYVSALALLGAIYGLATARGWLHFLNEHITKSEISYG